MWDIHDDMLQEYGTEISTGLGLPPWANHIAFDSPDLDDLKLRARALARPRPRLRAHRPRLVHVDLRRRPERDHGGVLHVDPRVHRRRPRARPNALLAASMPDARTDRAARSSSSPRRRRRSPHMDFAPSARSDELKAKLVEFDTEIVRPAEAVYRAATRRVGRPALPAAGDGGAEDRGAQARPLEPLHARGRPRRQALEPRLRAAVRGDGRVAAAVGGDELRGARHRQHGDPRPVRHAAPAGAVARSRCSTARSARASR